MKGKLTVKSIFDNDEVIEYTTDAEVGVQWKRTMLHVDLSLRLKRYPDPYVGGAPKGAIPD